MFRRQSTQSMYTCMFNYEGEDSLERVIRVRSGIKLVKFRTAELVMKSIFDITL